MISNLTTRALVITTSSCIWIVSIWFMWNLWGKLTITTRALITASTAAIATTTSSTITALRGLVDTNDAPTKPSPESKCQSGPKCTDSIKSIYVLNLVHSLDGLVGSGLIGVTNKSKPTASTSFTILYNHLRCRSERKALPFCEEKWTYHIIDFTKFRKLGTKSVFIRLPRKAAIRLKVSAMQRWNNCREYWETHPMNSLDMISIDTDYDSGTGLKTQSHTHARTHWERDRRPEETQWESMRNGKESTSMQYMFFFFFCSRRQWSEVRVRSVERTGARTNF